MNIEWTRFKIFVVFTSFCMDFCWTASAGQNPLAIPSSNTSGLQRPQPFHAAPSKQRMLVARTSERDLIAKIRSVPKDKLIRYKTDAAKRLQANLIRIFRAMSTNTKEIPARVRPIAKACLKATQSGKLTSTIANNIHIILQQGSQHEGRPAEQLQVVLGSLIPNVPPAVGNPLQGLLDFVSTNLAGVNTLLGKLLGGAPDLLAGVIKSLTNSLGAVTEAANGALGSLGALLGGALG